MPPLTDLSYIIGRYTLQPGRQLLLGKRALPLGSKALDLLTMLAEAGGALVTKDELMAAVWPGIVVEENAIQVHISAARKVLGADADRLRTVRGRGYRLDAVPKRTVAAQHGADAPDGSVAVLAFANLTGDPDKDYLSDGIAEEIITTLSRCRDLKVPARTSSFAYKNRNLDARTIARELGVSKLLEGSVRSAGDRLRVTAQLVEASTGFHIWAQNFDRSSDDLLALQDDLAAAIGRALETRISLAGVHRPDPRAYRLHLQARGLAARMTPEAVLKAIDLHAEAIACDALFPSAWAGLAGTLMVATVGGFVPLDRRAEARDTARRAIELDPGSSSPYAICGVLDAMAGRWVDAERGFRAAIDLDPSNPSAFEAMAHQLLAPCGYLGKARECARLATELAPASPNIRLSCAYFAMLTGDMSEAVAQRDAAAMLGAPAGRTLFNIVESEIAYREGRFDAAAGHMADAFASMDGLQAARIGDTVKAVYAAFAGNGDRTKAQSAIIDLVAATDCDDGLWRYQGVAGHLIRWQVLLGSLSGGFAIADRLLAAWRRSGHLAAASLAPMWRDDMAPFRADARFDALVDALGVGRVGSSNSSSLAAAIIVGRPPRDPSSS